MKLCVVTDIFSAPAPADCLSAHLPGLARIEHHCLSALSGAPDLRGPDLHQYLFQHGGMDIAVRALAGKVQRDWFGLGYSAGGTALWKTASRHIPLRALYCVSSTRLRFETEITTPTCVFFGEEDPNIPAATWRATIPDRCTLLANAGHSFYLDQSAKQISVAMHQIAADMAKR